MGSNQSGVDVDASIRALQALLAAEEQRRATVAGLLVTPQATLDYMNRVNAAMRNTDDDVDASSKLPPEFRTQWKRFLAAWYEFYNEHLSWWARQWSSVYDETEVYENELIGWRGKMRAYGEVPESPDPQGPAIPKDPLASAASSVFKVAAGAALLVGAAMFLGRRK